MTYTDADVIKALCAWEAQDRDLRSLRRFISDAFPGISKEQTNRCMEVAFAAPPTNAATDAAATKAVADALRDSGYDNLGELLKAGGAEVDELVAKLKVISERTRLRTRN